MSKINKPGSYQLDVYDNEIPDELQKNVYNFLFVILAIFVYFYPLVSCLFLINIIK